MRFLNADCSNIKHQLQGYKNSWKPLRPFIKSAFWAASNAQASKMQFMAQFMRITTYKTARFANRPGSVLPYK
jgi:hypothetical protein